MSQLTFEEFRKLPRDVQNIRYKELSDHDKFLARMNDWQLPKDQKPMTIEKWEQMPPWFKELFEEFKPSS